MSVPLGLRAKEQCRDSFTLADALLGIETAENLQPDTLQNIVSLWLMPF